MVSLMWPDLEAVEIMPGFFGKMIHTSRMTIIHFSIPADSRFPEHSHPQEQVSWLVSGRFELTVGGKAILMEPGRVIVIAPGEPHWGRALTDCQIVDTFSPPREDYRILQTL